VDAIINSNGYEGGYGVACQLRKQGGQDFLSICLVQVSIWVFICVQEVSQGEMRRVVNRYDVHVDITASSGTC
jgi:hypothetical protein